MKSLKELLSFLCILLIWILGFKLSEIYWKHKKFTDKETIKICVIGLIILFTIYSSDYIIPR